MSPSVCRYCGRPVSHDRVCRTCECPGVRVVHPAPDLATVRVVPPELEHGPFGVGDAAALRAEVEP